jgi:hypothetical protein
MPIGLEDDAGFDIFAAINDRLCDDCVMRDVFVVFNVVNDKALLAVERAELLTDENPC